MTGTPASSIDRMNVALEGLADDRRHDRHILVRNRFAELQQTSGGAG